MDDLQLDLLTVIARLEQLRDLGWPERADPLGALLWMRVLECDLPRLRGHLAREALDFERSGLPSDQEGISGLEGSCTVMLFTWRLLLLASTRMSFTRWWPPRSSIRMSSG